MVIWKCAGIRKYNGNAVGYKVMVDASAVEVSLHVKGVSNYEDGCSAKEEYEASIGLIDKLQVYLVNYRGKYLC
jgi:hypothetical protein